jgi:hypothetical protein
MLCIKERNLEDDEEDDETSVMTSSNNFQLDFDDLSSISSSSSELQLSIILRSSNDNDSTLSLTALHDEPESTTNDEDTSLTEQTFSSDQESVLFLRLSNELKIDQATLDSDLERIDPYSS